MRHALLAFGSVLLLVSCDHIQPPGRDAPRSLPQQSANVPTLEVTEALLSLTQEWVDTWNRRDIERMAQMHGDVAHTVYVIGETSSTVEWLLQEIRDKNFWNLSWKLAVLKPHVRVLGPDAGLVSFRLVGEETGVGGTKPFSAAFSLVFQKLDGEWKIVHVQDSSRLEEPAPPTTDASPE